MAKVSYGLVGYGGIAHDRIAKEGFGLDAGRFAGHPFARLVGATDINAALRPAAQSLGLPWFSTYDELLASKEVEAVYVTTSNASHFEVAERALRAGKHVLLEKPLTTRLEDAKALQTIARESGLSICADHMMTHNAYNMKARDLVHGGAIGEVNDICLHMEFQYGSTAEEAATWRCSDPLQLGGPIGDVGSHCLYMAEFLLGSHIAKIACVYLPRTLDLAVENGAFIQFETESRKRGSARVAFNQPRGGLVGTLQNLGFEVYGSGGAIRSFGTMFQLSGHGGEPVKLRLELETGNGLESVEPGERTNIYQAQIEVHARSILAGQPLAGEDALRNLALLDLCHRSARDGGMMLAV